MEDTGFWFINYNIHCEAWDKTPKSSQCVSDQHPFEWLKLLSKLSSFKRILINWKNISEDEFISGKKIIGVG